MFGLRKWIWLAGLAMASIGVSHAQTVTSCPPGMVPYGAGVCGYDQSQDQPSQSAAPQTPPARWDDAWGSIASYVPKGILGFSTGQPTKQQAVIAALQDCHAKGGADCSIELTYGNQCAAVVVGNPDFGAFAAPTPGDAAKKAMKSCIDGGNTNCRIVYSACSLPHRIQ